LSKAKFASLFPMSLVRLLHAFLRRLPLMKAFTIHCEWDDVAKVWYVSESDVPGLVGEAPTVEEMNDLLRKRIPELLALNCPQNFKQEREVPWELVAKGQDSVALASS